MMTNDRSILKTAGFRRFLLASALVCAAVSPAFAQDTTAQQLPPAAVQQQVPPAFPDMSNTAVQPIPATVPIPGTENAPAVTTSSTTTRTTTTAVPGQAVQQQETTTQQTQTQPAQGSSGQQGAVQPSPEQIPAQPAERRLVPSTAMGSAAQQADNGQGGAPAEGTGNPVEDAAMAADQSMAAQQAAAPPPSILDQYTADPEPAQQAADALPQVNNLNMVTLEGEGFSSAAAKKVNVAVDGSLDSGKTPEELQEEIRTEAFDAAITGMFPLSPEQIDGLLKRYDTTQRAVQSPAFNNPKPEVSVQNISLDPGVAPPSIKTAVGNVTTLNILDATGAPWPVQDVTWAGDFEIVEPEEGGHIIRITPMSHFARGNIVIRMLTLKTPLTMTLETSRDIVQYRVDARIPEYGPFASAPLMQGGKSLVAGSSDLTSILDGVAPGGMAKLQVSGVDGRTTAYSSGETTYVRTPLTLLSPAWQSSVSSADGMNVYALGNAPVLLLSDGGEFVRATLQEKEDLLDE